MNLNYNSMYVHIYLHSAYIFLTELSMAVSDHILSFKRMFHSHNVNIYILIRLAAGMSTAISSQNQYHQYHFQNVMGFSAKMNKY